MTDIDKYNKRKSVALEQLKSPRMLFNFHGENVVYNLHVPEIRDSSLFIGTIITSMNSEKKIELYFIPKVSYYA